MPEEPQDAADHVIPPLQNPAKIDQVVFLQEDDEAEETSEFEQGYLAAERAIGISLLRDALRRLDQQDPEAERARWVLERQEVVQRLRRLCHEYGDNSWTDRAHLADVIESYLVKPLTNR
jgi:hypothetical protein